MAETDEKFQLDHATPHPTLSGALTSLPALSSLCFWIFRDPQGQGLCWNTHLPVRFPSSSRAVLEFSLLRRPLDYLTDTGQVPPAYPLTTAHLPSLGQLIANYLYLLSVPLECQPCQGTPSSPQFQSCA